MPILVCFGELLLRLSAPRHERLLQSPHLQVFFGGAEANVAAAFAAFGHSAAMVTVLPDNPLGMATLASLRSQNIGTDHVYLRPGRMGLYFHTLGAMQRPSEVLYDREHSAFALADPTLFDWRVILRDADWLHVTGITAAVSERAAQAALQAVQTARELNVSVSFDCNYRARVWGTRAGEAPAILKELSSYAQLLFANDHDLQLMLGEEATAITAFGRFPALRFIVRSLRNATSVDRHTYSGELITTTGKYRSRTHELSGIVERIGAGDAFAAGLLHRLVTTTNATAADLQGAIEFATAAACYKHSLPGDACIASAAEIESALASVNDIQR